MDISQEPFRAAIYKKNAGPPFPAGHFARACAIEMHIDMSQELFCVEIYGENAGPPGGHLDETRGLYCYRKSLSVWPHCLGNGSIDGSVFVGECCMEVCLNFLKEYHLFKILGDDL